MRVLAGDVGGTHTRLLLADVDHGRVVPVAEHRYPSRDYDGLAAIARRFLDSHELPERACFAVAGPVRGGRARITNLPWELVDAVLARDLGIERVALINDFAGIGYGLGVVEDERTESLQTGRVDPGGTRAYLGAGTGLGQGILVPCGDDYVVVATEGGHTDFAPRTPLEVELFEYWRARLGRVSWEHLLSGPGLARVFDFLRDCHPEPLSVDMETALAETEDRPATISRFALDHDEPLAVRALECFVAVYGAQAGNLALTTLATGGLDIAGGVAGHIVTALQWPAFIEAFRAKAPMEELMAGIPVRVVTDPRVGLLGAAVRAARED